MYIYRGKFDWYEYAKDEAITIIFPASFHRGESAYVCWQWTRSPEGQPKAAFVDIGTVNFESTPTPASENKFTLSCSDYKFDVSLTPEFETLSLVMHHHENQGRLNLSLVDGGYPTGASTPSVYVGKMDWSDAMVSAVNELFLVVIPESFATDKPLCAFWQWSKRNDEDTKVNVDCLVQIQSTPDSDADTFTFSDSYRFGANLGEGDKKLAVTMKSRDGKTCKTTDLVLLTLQERTCTIRNNLPNSEVVTCTLRESGTGTIDKVLAGVGLVAAGLGLATLHPTFAKYGTTVAYAGAGLAVTGAAHAFYDAPDAVRGALFHEESIQRQHRLLGDNDIEVLRATIKPDNGRHFLVISLSRKEKVQNGNLDLSDVLNDSELKVRELLWLQLSTSTGHSFKSFRELKFTSIGLIQGGGGESYEDSIIPGGLFSVNPNAANTKQLYHGRLSPNSQPHELFRYQADPKSFIAVGQSDTDSGGDEDGVTRYTILTLSDHKLVLKLLDYYIHDDVFIDHCQDEEAVKTVIKREEDSASPSPYVAYTFNPREPSPRKLYGAKRPGLGENATWKVVKSDVLGDSVYFVAASGPLVYRKIITPAS
jgi:hypothetical protein